MSRWKRCSVLDCDRPSLKNGLCQAHWNRKELHPEIPIRAPYFDPYRKKDGTGTRRAVHKAVI
jgi:hypothetical protein